MARFHILPLPGNETVQAISITECATSEEALRAIREFTGSESLLAATRWDTAEVNGLDQTLRVTGRHKSITLVVDSVGLGYGSAGLNTAAILHELARRGSYENFLARVQEARWNETILVDL